MEELFPIVIAACVACAAWGSWALWAHISRSDQRKLAQRLAGTGGAPGDIEQQTSILIQAEAAPLQGLLGRLALFRKLNKCLLHAYPEASLPRFLALIGGMALVAFFILLLLSDSLFSGTLAALGAGYLPVMFVAGKSAKRQRLLTEQLPDALEFLQRVLRAGHSLSTGLSMMGDELPHPLGAEFRRCYDQHSLGQPLEQAMRDMAARIESTDFAFFVTAVLIQRQTGGDLSMVLGNISSMIRQRIRLAQYVKAKTAEGRFTGYILVAFPILLFFVASSMNADYKKNLLDDPTGRMLLGIAIGLVFAGMIAIRKITTVKV